MHIEFFTKLNARDTWLVKVRIITLKKPQPFVIVRLVFYVCNPEPSDYFKKQLILKTNLTSFLNLSCASLQCLLARYLLDVSAALHMEILCSALTCSCSFALFVQ